MSSRAMKKLLRDSQGPAPLKDLEHSTAATTKKDSEDHEEQISDEDQDEEQELDDEYTPRKPPARNLFALVCQLIPHPSYSCARILLSLRDTELINSLIIPIIDGFELAGR